MWKKAGRKCSSSKRNRKWAQRILTIMHVCCTWHGVIWCDKTWQDDIMWQDKYFHNACIDQLVCGGRLQCLGWRSLLSILKMRNALVPLLPLHLQVSRTFFISFSILSTLFVSFSFRFVFVNVVIYLSCSCFSFVSWREKTTRSNAKSKASGHLFKEYVTIMVYTYVWCDVVWYACVWCAK